jgi:hypothetical protein
MGQKDKAQKSWLSVHWPMIVLGTAAIALFSGIGYVAIHTTPRKPETGAAAVPVYYDRAEDAMPFPSTLEPASFKRSDVREAYQTAKEIPGVLAQQPCYCYCQRKGHHGLLDCFKTDHAASCNICVREAVLANQMHREGKSAEEIRRTIVQRQWASSGDSHE